MPEETPTPEPTAEPEPTKVAADGPQLNISFRLYLGGDASGTYSDERYARVWNKDGYTVKFFSDNEKVVTVGRNRGLVTAVGVGKATITAVFTDARGNTITHSCKVTVKRNSVDAGVSRGTAEKLQKLKVGDKLQTVAYRTASGGITSWGGRDVITDGMRFTSSDESVFTVGRTKGKIVAVGAGEAVLTVWAVQSEEAVYDENGEFVEYRATTKPRTYKVKVTAE
ncbi:MAG: Ig-like domain-containing protein [Lachnospiraceae bacterium]|nr:Ig-like domain-containing protein [Lachnospiraceae bacterium]